MEDLEDILIILISAMVPLIMAIVSIRNKVQKRSEPDSIMIQPDLKEEMNQEGIRSVKPEQKPIEFLDLEEEKSINNKSEEKIVIDKKKLIIYSEIMKQKF